MDLVPILFLALIALVSGGIAYFADWLGRKLGKKRLRLGGLRPKHTAALGVVSSGFLISVFTIGLVYLSSSDVRQWIREGRFAIKKLNDAVVQRDAADKEREAINQLNKGLRADSLRRQIEIDHARETLNRLNGKMVGLQSQIAANRVAAATLQRKLDSVQTEYVLSTKSLQSTEAQRKLAQKALASIQKEYVTLQESYHSLNSSYAALFNKSRDIEAYNTKVTKENISLITSNASLEAKGLDLEAKNKDVAQSLEQASSKLERQTKEIDRQEKELVEMTTATRIAEERVGRLNVILDSSRVHPMTFAAHEELARVSLPAKVTKEEVRDSITSLLREARTVAESKGAKGHGNDIPAAAIFPREDKDAQRQVEPEEIISSMVNRVTGRPGEQVLVASSSINAFEGEPVSIDLTAYPNPLVYKAQQVVAETRINGSDNEEKIVSNITTFLNQKVRNRLKTDHLIPNGDDSFGNVGLAEILKIVKTVQSADRSVRLQAYVRNNTRAGDPLQIDFRIR